MSPKGLRIFPGNLSDYVERIKSEGKIVLRSSENRGQKKVADAKERRAEAAKKREQLSKLKKEAAKIESQIAEAESDLAQVELEMSSPDFFKRGAQCASITENYNALKSRIENLYKEWESATEAIAELE